MLVKPFHWIFAFAVTLLVVVGGMFSQPEQVYAGSQADLVSNTCLTCHEDLYYLHDTGCGYCMTVAHKDRCTDCHEGNSASLKTEAAHLGMIIHPQEQNGAKCLECHTEEEAKTLLQTFDANVGFDTVITAKAYSPERGMTLGFTEIDERNTFLENWKWIVGTSLVFGLWLFLVLVSPTKP